MFKNKFSIIIFTILFLLFNQYLVSVFMKEALLWYKTIKKSNLQPPSWVFSVVWSLIYTSWYVGLYYVYTNFSIIKQSFLTHWFLSLYLLVVMQTAWSYIFSKHILGFLNILFIVFSLVSSWYFNYISFTINSFIGSLYLLQSFWLFLATILSIHTYLIN